MATVGLPHGRINRALRRPPAKPKPIEQNKPDKRAKTTKKPDVEFKEEDVKRVSGGRMPTAVE
jgi:hypothetical protein